MKLTNMVKAWDKEKNRMCNVVFMDFIKPQIGLHCIGYGSYGQHPNDVIILKNTGLKDKNGKEIYEGDICTNEYDLEDYYYVVEWVFSGFQLVTYQKAKSEARGISNGINQGYMEDADGIKVVGNIYQNPESLK